MLTIPRYLHNICIIHISPTMKFLIIAYFPAISIRTLYCACSVMHFVPLCIVFLPIALATPDTRDVCSDVLTEQLKMEIQSYKPVRNEIFDYVLKGMFKGRTYKK